MPATGRPPLSPLAQPDLLDEAGPAFSADAIIKDALAGNGPRLIEVPEQRLSRA
jgi:hypothetical protein